MKMCCVGRSSMCTAWRRCEVDTFSRTIEMIVSYFHSFAVCSSDTRIWNLSSSVREEIDGTRTTNQVINGMWQNVICDSQTYCINALHYSKIGSRNRIVEKKWCAPNRYCAESHFAMLYVPDASAKPYGSNCFLRIKCFLKKRREKQIETKSDDSNAYDSWLRFAWLGVRKQINYFFFFVHQFIIMYSVSDHVMASNATTITKRRAQCEQLCSK